MTVAVAVTAEQDVRAPDGRTLRAYAAGPADGTLVVVHHGTPAGGLLAGWWVDDAAARGLRLVGYDRPGYGGSTRQPGRTIADAAGDAAAIADAYGADRFLTWGVSGGGPHALACAALSSDRVIAAAAVASVAPYDADGLDFLTGMGQDNIDEFGAALDGEDKLRPWLSAAREGVLSSTPDSLAETMRSLLPDADAAAMTGDVAVFLHRSMTSGQRAGVDGWLDDDLAFVAPWGFRVQDIRVPVLLLQGRLDLMVPFAHGEWLASHLPTATARLTDDDGHITLAADLGPVHDWLHRQV
jgi:pimeloyl-ACP methyl ester carboxylesterase